MTGSPSTAPLEAIERAVASVRDPADAAQVAAALRAVSPALVDDVVFGIASSTEGSTADGVLLGVGVAAAPGVGVGLVALDAVSALEAWEHGREVVLLVDQTSPADEPAMRVASAIVTRRGGVSSHAAIVARQWGVPAVCGIGALDVAVGEQLLVDGATGEIRRLTDTNAVVAHDGPLNELPAALHTLLGWADGVAETRIAVLANADQAADVVLALDLGARGVGLCRTEHQFLGDRAQLVRRLLAGDSGAVAEMVAVQRADLRALIEAATPHPVTIRLLDAPRHEFEGDHAEHNPMLGVRGVRFSVLHPAAIVAQVEALAHAVADVAADQDGALPDVRVMVPMVTLGGEMTWARSVIGDVLFRVGIERGLTISVAVGAMIETPRSALCAAELATHSDFFSFGTNDLTQLTWGFSRDDLDASLLPAYRSRGLVERSPFETLDGSGVVRLMALAAETGRGRKESLGLGMCGEHGGDPASIAVAIQLGLDSISVSPYRIPAARLSAAHAVLGPPAGSPG